MLCGRNNLKQNFADGSVSVLGGHKMPQERDAYGQKKMQEFRIWYFVSCILLFRHNMWRFAVSTVWDVIPVGSGVLCIFGGRTNAAAADGVLLDPTAADGSDSCFGAMGGPCAALAHCLAGLRNGIFCFCLLCRWRNCLAVGLAWSSAAAAFLWCMPLLSEAEPCMGLPSPKDRADVRISL